MKHLLTIVCVLLAFGNGLTAAHAADKPSPLQSHGDPVMGDWQGTWGDAPLCAQVIALGNGEYSANVLAQFDTRDPALAVLSGKQSGGAVRFTGTKDGTTWSGVVDQGRFIGATEGEHAGAFELKPVKRLSPTLGKKAPDGAVVLFDGASLDGWLHITPDPRVLDLSKLLGGDNRVAYLRSQVWSPAAQTVRLELGSDDGVKAWLNGALVHANNTLRGAAPGQDTVDVTLLQGWNTLLLKITQGSGGWGACAQFAATDGSPALGLFVLDQADLLPQNAPQSGSPLEDNIGAILAWHVSGPYTQAGAAPEALFEIAFPPEQDAAQAAWEWRPFSKQEPETCQWKLLDTGATEVRDGGVVSARGFKDHMLHLEFRTPFMPDAREQGRGNSGVYLQGRYEVQILDSYGLEGAWNECGGIYQVAVPRVNMAAPPLQWQTYDITFHAPQCDAAGRKVKDATITVLHNGVTIHENVAIPDPTAGHIGGDICEAQGVHLQDHGNPVQFRNIWAVEIE